MKKIGMKKERELIGKSLEELSVEIGYDIVTLEKIEKNINYANIHEKVIISNALNCKEDDL